MDFIGVEDRTGKSRFFESEKADVRNFGVLETSG
jgi:hypothetical protein